jgi:hypothetical protein
MAFAAALEWVARSPSRRCVISSFSTTWCDEVLASPEAAIGRLITLFDHRFQPANPPWQRKILSQADLCGSDPHAALLQDWHEADGSFDRERLSGYLDRALESRFVVAIGNASGRLTFVEVGAGLPLVRQDWGKPPLEGGRVEDMPDHGYGRWVASCMREVLKNRAPMIDDVMVDISLTRGRMKSGKYRRVILPYTMVDGRSAVLSTTRLQHVAYSRSKSSESVGQL